ncbi:double-stranded RNA-binding protein Staufen homolog 2 isoform X1 [Zootoca vivipara]|uniref:double-stranded RNA-binding protein Staufen homolog 2 isoform X1 n=1 Tax=Zootoca vivipara TaxID=8524 RepID=UPI001591323D|nr:double-stranded RNA-binding protein Staufen homolog 2 isoform X1 [Zootoca vivipara]XP_034981843.1 double-stranded RNA-binding protein Staufen homolog 2 isoform X1 [Zootoca vivipara]XP_060133731.1 double-stranded RNA-binding protein Staufen homolog 2 isoform X1 [Zootoca vivipara]
MAQVKMQTTPNHSGPSQSPAVLTPSVTATGSVVLQPSVNGSIPEAAVDCNNSTTGQVDSIPSSNSQVPLQDNMANPKEKTPMCLVNELARFNRIQPLYKLLNERGPAHAKMFTVQLTLGEQTWDAEGSSIKKAHHSAARKALSETTLPKPAPRPPKNNVNNNPGSITPTVELNGLAMKRGEPAIYRPLDQKPVPNYRANYNFRGMYNQRYHCPVPKIFYVQLTVGDHEFFGEGKTRQAARHNAAMKALQALQNEPIPPKLPQNGEPGNEMEDEKDANKSEISVVFEIALKHSMPVSFEVIKESGPPHMKSFVTQVSVGEFSAEGEGNSKKLSKKRAAIGVLQELRKLPPLPVIEKPKLHFKKRPRTMLKTGPEYGQGMNPISRLAQIQQAKREKEPEYLLISERGMPRRREFVMQVKVGNEITTGTGPNKKIAKRNAAEAILLQLGYKASSSLQEQMEKPGDIKGWNGQNVEYPESANNAPKGILHLSPDVYQEMEASRNKASPGTPVNYLSSKEMSQASSCFFSTSPVTNNTATIARELLMNGTSPTAEAIGLKGMSVTAPCSTVQPSKQLEYLARIQGFQVHYSDRQNGKECMTCLTLSPVQMTFHGIGSCIEASHDQAALSALKQFSEQGLDPLEGTVKTENGSFEKQVKHLGENADNKQTNSGTIAQDCKDSKAVV